MSTPSGQFHWVMRTSGWRFHGRWRPKRSPAERSGASAAAETPGDALGRGGSERTGQSSVHLGSGPGPGGVEVGTFGTWCLVCQLSWIRIQLGIRPLPTILSECTIQCMAVDWVLCHVTLGACGSECGPAYTALFGLGTISMFQFGVGEEKESRILSKRL